MAAVAEPEAGAAGAGASAVDVLSDEVLEQLCLCLPGRELLRFAATSRQQKGLTSGSAVILWSHLSHALLGDVAFWTALFRRGQELRAARWSLDLREAFLRPAGGGSDDGHDHGLFQSCTEGSGHCTVGLGRLVVKVGGLRPHDRREHLHACVFDLEALAMREVALAPDSAEPERRLRHAACEVRPALTGGQPAVLVLGGCHDRTKKACQGGLQLLHILEILSEDGSLARWHSLQADGACPGAIWHHVCGSFRNGTRVVVFGGDFPKEDPEHVHILDRALPASFVYVLDVDRRLWERVLTRGPAPTWRSLHTGFTHRDIASHSERLVVLGGCAEHVRIFGSSDQLEEMCGHALDLGSFEWQPQPAQGPDRPPARLRFAAEKIGEWLVLYGGHGPGEEIGERAALHKLNLRTLQWDTFEVRGREGRFPAAPAATLTAGLCLGGVQFGMLGITPVPKLDVLTLCGEATDSEEALAEDEADRLAAEAEAQRRARAPEGEGEEDDDDGDVLVSVAVRGSNGSVQRMMLPRSVLQRLLARQRAAAAGGGGGGGGAESSGSSSSGQEED